MKKNILIALLVIVTMQSVALSVQAEEETMTIMCTNSILADFSAQLLQENVTVEYIMPAGVCPAHFDTSPSDVTKIASADFIISLGWEPWLDSLVTSAGNNDAIHIRCSNLGEWNYPAGAEKYITTLRDEFALYLPAMNETIHTNADAYIVEINQTVEHLKEMIVDNGFQGKNVICMQWQEYFVETLGLNISYAYGPPESLSMQDELAVITAASQVDICAIIDNLQSGTEFGARVAAESGASHVIFTNFPHALPGTDTYLDMLTYNTNQLIEGMKTYDYKASETTQSGVSILDLEKDISSLELQRNLLLTGFLILALTMVVLVLLYKKQKGRA